MTPDRLIRALQQFIRRLLQRPPSAPPYPQTVERVFSSGRRLRFTITSDPRTWPDTEAPAFIAPITLPHPDDDDVSIETVRPKMIPPLAVQIAALRLRALETADLLDDHDDDQERDRRFIWWWRRARDQGD